MDRFEDAFTHHASERAAMLWPGEDWLAVMAAGELIDHELVWALTQRRPSRASQRDRYVLSPDRRGIFVVSPDDHVITVLRLGEQQRRILDGSGQAPAQPVASSGRQAQVYPSPERIEQYLYLEFFPGGSFCREMVRPEVEVTCNACQGTIQPGTWTMRVRVFVAREAPLSAARRPRRVCFACLDRRLAELAAVPS